MEYACDYKPLQQSKKPLQKRRSDSELKVEKVAGPENPLISPRKESITLSNRPANQSLVSDTEMKPIQQTATFFFIWNNFGASKKYSYDSSNALIVDYRKTSDGIEFTVQEPATNMYYFTIYLIRNITNHVIWQHWVEDPNHVNYETWIEWRGYWWHRESWQLFVEQRGGSEQQQSKLIIRCPYKAYIIISFFRKMLQSSSARRSRWPFRTKQTSF